MTGELIPPMLAGMSMKVDNEKIKKDAETNLAWFWRARRAALTEVLQEMERFENDAAYRWPFLKARVTRMLADTPTAPAVDS